MLSWPDFYIMSFGCSYSVNMYMCILGLAFFYSWAVFGTGYCLQFDILYVSYRLSYCVHIRTLIWLSAKDIHKVTTNYNNKHETSINFLSVESLLASVWNEESYGVVRKFRLNKQ